MRLTHTKKILDTMHRCYSVSALDVDGTRNYIVASEAIDGEARMYSGAGYEDIETIWEKRGGTMSIVPIPGSTKTEFLAIQNFFPGFNARDVRIVKMARIDGVWHETPIINIPYCHRFELIVWHDEIYIVAATLCTWKNEREDWGSPGHVFVGKYDPEQNLVNDFKLLIPNLTQNHGMLKVENDVESHVLISTREGVYKVFFDDQEGTVSYKHILKTPSSETVYIDIDNDGEVEAIAIQPFHGNELGIYKEDGSLMTVIKRNTNFLHSLWSGYVGGRAVYVCGGRRVDSDMYIGYFDTQSQSFQEYLIDSGNGSANIVVTVSGNHMEIISTNNSCDEIALYEIDFEMVGDSV